LLFTSLDTLLYAWTDTLRAVPSSPAYSLRRRMKRRSKRIAAVSCER
jgi:hypothetical protein